MCRSGGTFFAGSTCNAGPPTKVHDCFLVEDLLPSSPRRTCTFDAPLKNLQGLQLKQFRRLSDQAIIPHFIRDLAQIHVLELTKLEETLVSLGRAICQMLRLRVQGA